MRIRAYDRLNVIMATAIFGVMTTGASLAAIHQSSSITLLTSGGEYVVKVVNKDQFQGKWKQFKGDLKKKWGNFTDDDLLVIEGDYDKFEGKLQERYGDKREDVRRWTDEWFEKNAERSK
jgi:uncharacterized protein YjbJ (UPF0337 family)